MNAVRDSDEPNRWLRHAQDDLRTADLLLSSDCGVSRHVVSQAHQAAEKALKTVLIIESTRVPRTHDLVALRGLHHERTADSVQDSELDWLTQEATGLRYPGDWIEADCADAERAVAIARVIVDDVAQRMRADHGANR